MRKVIIALGVLAVLVGGADASTRLSKSLLGENASLVAFAPVITLVDPQALNAVTPGAEVQTPLIPARLKVASIGVDASVEQVGRAADGSMANPSTFFTVGWYKPGPKPGEVGNAVFAGHVNNARSAAGVFENLKKIKIGDMVEVSDTGGRKLLYKIETINEYPRAGAPLEEIFTTSGPSRLVLITCDGDWDATAGSYDRRLVVVARLSSL